jgi:hypothetical protein
MRTEELKLNWNKVVNEFSIRFGEGEEIDVDGILFIIGVQEVGKGFKKYKKSEKLDLMHVAICRLLEPYGYYVFKGMDEHAWPHYEASSKLPFLKSGEQSLLIKEAIVNYCIDNQWV